MKIRNRITLWITLAGTLASLVLSLIVFFEMIDEPYELLDQELESNAKALARNFHILSNDMNSVQENGGKYITSYWVKITDKNHRVIFQSELAAKVNLPVEDIKGGYSINTDILLNTIIPDPEEEEGELATFRVRVFKFSHSGQEHTYQIARPVENINQEIVEMLVTIEVGLVLSALVLIFISYYVAGRILQPIKDINDTALEFNEKALSKRIPLGENKDELYELSSSLNLMFDRLQHSFQKQKEFVANASHELKTPITMLRISLEELIQEEELSESYKKMLGSQNKTVLRMDRLVKNLLDLSTLELSETLTMEEFALNELVSSVILDFDPLMKLRNIHFTVHMKDRIIVKADREQIKRILINLFENAIKYNEDDGEIRLQLQSGKQDQNLIVLLFNTGPGIPIEEQEKVFEQFYRVEKSRSTSLGGFGLGLTIVKRIVDLHGGTISLNSKPNHWTQLQIILPILSGNCSS